MDIDVKLSTLQISVVITASKCLDFRTYFDTFDPNKLHNLIWIDTAFYALRCANAQSAPFIRYITHKTEIHKCSFLLAYISIAYVWIEIASVLLLLSCHALRQYAWNDSTNFLNSLLVSPSHTHSTHTMSLCIHTT